MDIYTDDKALLTTSQVQFTLRNYYESIDRMFYFNGYAHFFAAHGQIPKRIIFPNIDDTIVWTNLMNEFPNSKNLIAESKTWNRDIGKEIGIGYYEVDENIYIYLRPNNLGNQKLIEILYNDSADQSIIERIENIIIKFVEKPSYKKEVFLFTLSYNGRLSAEPFEFQNVKINLNENYNDDLIEINNHIVTELNKEKGKGVVLLHGEPGTGKTYYLRHLIQTVKKNCIIVPPDMAKHLGDPGFITLLKQNKDSILIIEDAETVIEQRSAGNSGVISNLLNLTDGLLSDLLSIQIICTFNMSISRIDKALIRKGRLINEYKFDKLSITKAQQLVNKLELNVQLEDNITLAEIFNLSSPAIKSQNKQIGF